MRVLLLCATLGGCCSLTQRVERVEVPVPVMQPCIAVADIPPIPRTRMPDADANVERLSAGASADVRELLLYAQRVDGLLRVCALEIPVPK